MVFQFLALGGHGAKDRAARIEQVGASVEELAIDQEVFLLGADGGKNLGDVLTEDLQDALGLVRQRVHRLEQRRFLVEGFVSPGDEGRRDDECRSVGRVHDVGGARRIPSRVTACLERGTQAAGGKRRRIGLALDEFLAGELRDGVAVAGGRQEAVVLLGSQAGHRLEKMRVVRGALLERPILHGAGDRVGDGRIEGVALLDGALQRLEDGLRKAFALGRLAEDVRSEQIFEGRLCEIEMVELMLGGGNALDNVLTT